MLILQAAIVLKLDSYLLKDLESHWCSHTTVYETSYKRVSETHWGLVYRTT
jgi:hypothetical protein